jgi:hypothetical protein
LCCQKAESIKTQKDYKDRNGGKISDEILEKFQDANDRIEVLEGLIKEAEERERKAEDELAIKKHSRRSRKS